MTNCLRLCVCGVSLRLEPHDADTHHKVNKWVREVYLPLFLACRLGQRSDPACEPSSEGRADTRAKHGGCVSWPANQLHSIHAHTHAGTQAQQRMIAGKRMDWMCKGCVRVMYVCVCVCVCVCVPCRSCPHSFTRCARPLRTTCNCLTHRGSYKGWRTTCTR